MWVFFHQTTKQLKHDTGDSMIMQYNKGRIPNLDEENTGTPSVLKLRVKILICYFELNLIEQKGLLCKLDHHIFYVIIESIMLCLFS